MFAALLPGMMSSVHRQIERPDNRTAIAGDGQPG
jgi:hypothetical protein